MNRFQKQIIFLAAACFVWLGFAHSALGAEHKSDLRVIYTPPYVSVEARGISLQQVLREIGAKVGFTVSDHGASDKPLTLSIQNATLKELLDQLLRSQSFALAYRGTTGREIEKVYLLSPSNSRPAMHNAGNQWQLERPEEQPSQRPERPIRPSTSLAANQLNVFSPMTLTREAKAEDEVLVTDLLRIHALSGFDPATGIFPDAEAVREPLGSPASSSISPRVVANTPRSTQAIQAALAAATHLAQQNLNALVGRLTTATDSLYQLAPK